MLVLFGAAVRLTAQELYQLPTGGVRSSVSSPENLNGEKGKGGLTNSGAKGNAYIGIKAGETVTLLDHSGVSL